MPNITVATPGSPDYITPSGPETAVGDVFAGSRILKENPFAGSSIVKPSHMSPLRSMGEGFLSGATADTSDELSGLSAASGAPEAKWLSAPLGAAKLLAEDNPVVKGDTPGPALETPKGPALSAYEKARDAVRADQKQAQEENPISYGAGVVGGAVATIPLTRGASVETLPARILSGVKQGAAYGAASGFGGGEGLQNSAVGAGTGAVVGAGLGVVAPVAGNLLGAPFEKGIAAYRAAKDPSGTALRDLVTVARKDNPGMSDSDIVQNLRKQVGRANSQGQNFTVGEGLGENARGLARSAFNLSDDAKSLLQNYAIGEFHGQASRAQNFFAGMTPGGKSPVQMQQAADDAARAANKPAYDKAFQQGDRPIWDESLAALAEDPTVLSAMRRASVAGKAEETRQGVRPFKQPFDFTGATVTLKRDPNGNTISPNLQYWDLVKRELDKGGRDSQLFAKSLRDHLDTIVPAYKGARSGAHEFFQAENAYDAGKSFVMSKSTPQFDLDAAKQLRKMDPAQRELFAQGFAAEMQRVMGQIGDTRDVLQSTFVNNPNARKRIEIALGPQRTSELEAFLQVERLKKNFHGAFGNSTTARQQYQMGLAGAGGLGSAEAFREEMSDGNLDPTKIALAATLGGASGYASARLKGTSDKVASQVAGMLLSGDPAVLERGLKLVAARPALMSRLRAATWDAAPQSANPILGGVRNKLIGGSVPASADEQPGANN